jgi:hypothetical protein
MIISHYAGTEVWNGAAFHFPKSRDRNVFPETELLIYIKSYV